MKYFVLGRKKQFIIKKNNDLKTLIVPIFTFVGTACKVPEKYLKKY